MKIYSRKNTNVINIYTDVKVKGKGMNAWETGVKSSDFYKFTQNTPYQPPFSFKIKSKTTGQEVTAWNIIDSLEENDSGVMTTKMASPFTYQDETENDGIHWTGIMAIIIGIIAGICILIGIGCYCNKRRKMKNAVSFKGTNQDTPEPSKDEDGDSVDTGVNEGAYDMSPIDVTKVETEEIEVDIEMNL